MTDEQARHQALAASGGAVTIFVGLGHEFVGLTLYPGAEAYFFGPVGWNAAGIACLLAGIALLAAALKLIRPPTWTVVATGILLAIAGAGAMALVAVLHRPFHLFALALVVWGLIVAYSYPRSLAA